MLSGDPAIGSEDLDNLLFGDVIVSSASAPKFVLNGKDVDIWSEEYKEYHSKSPVDYMREKILSLEKTNKTPFPEIVGKSREKELAIEGIFSGSPLLFKGRRGYGKTTFSKAIAKLLPDRILAIKGCKIYDDPTRPTCFSCKRKVLSANSVELAWMPRVWVRVPGDPMLTTRQLIGGISIQKIREGIDLDDPEVFVPGRALKANRGVGYFDELGAIPTALQTLLHELFEEGQVTTTEGDLVPFKISTLELASTNPANYRGTSPIKEPLLDRMEEIEIGPPETLEEEIEIARRNVYISRRFGQEPAIPDWHMKILSRTVRYGRDEHECAIAKKIQSEPSCRATIKLFDHLISKALRSGRQVPLLSDYGEDYQVVELGMSGRIELEYGAKEDKKQVIRSLFQEAFKKTLKDIYDKIPASDFDVFYNSVIGLGKTSDDGSFISINQDLVPKLRGSVEVLTVIESLLPDGVRDDETYLSAIEILLQAISMCSPKSVERQRDGYAIRRVTQNEA